MILKIKAWCEGIIVAIIISIIIELLVPEGSNKKYIKVVIGVYIMFIILNPFFELLNFDYDFNFLENYRYEEVYSNLNNDIGKVYVTGIEETIKQDLEEMGYDANVNVFVDLNYENIEKIEIKIKNNIEIKNIIIGEDNTEKRSYDDIKEYLKTNYLVDEEKVFFI